MNKNIEKPIGLLRKELVENIVTSINESGLPLSMVVYILKETFDTIVSAAAQQEDAEITEYQAKLAQAESENSEQSE